MDSRRLRGERTALYAVTVIAFLACIYISERSEYFWPQGYSNDLRELLEIPFMFPAFLIPFAFYLFSKKRLRLWVSVVSASIIIGTELYQFPAQFLVIPNENYTFKNVLAVLFSGAALAGSPIDINEITMYLVAVLLITAYGIPKRADSLGIGEVIGWIASRTREKLVLGSITFGLLLPTRLALYLSPLLSAKRGFKVRRSGGDFEFSNGKVRLRFSYTKAITFLIEYQSFEKYYVPKFSLEGKTVLSIGEGEGETAQLFFSRGSARVIGIDSNPLFIKRLRENSEINAWDLTAISKRFELEDLRTRFDYCKMDIEGGEDELLQLASIDFPLIVEVHGRDLVSKFLNKFPELKIIHSSLRYETCLLSNCS